MRTDRRFVIRVGAILGALVLLLVAGECGYKKLAGLALDWVSLKKAIRKDYPAVPQMSTAEYAALVKEKAAHVLIDAREPAEFEVSHLEDALNLRSVRDVKAGNIPRESPLILYCSVGYRSSALAEKLIEAGYRNVSNLEGSIFAWANERRPIVAPEGAKTTRVHPYNEHWGALLDESVVEKAEGGE